MNTKMLLVIFATLFWLSGTVSAICTPACQNGGNCLANNTCSCTTGYLPPDCSIPICSVQNCTGHGTCTAPETCVCTNSSQWTGAYCHKPVCPSNCNFPNHGTCTAPGVCTCYSNNGTYYYGGTACEIPLCYPACQNDGTCMIPGGSLCYCPSQWMGIDCTAPAATVYVGSADYPPDGWNTWAMAMLPKLFSPDLDTLAATGFDAQPETPEHCCPCGSFIQDGNCYFLSQLPSSMPYMESKHSDYLLNNLHGCYDQGGTLATFEKGSSAQKMANVFKWLATDSNIQFGNKPVDAFNASNDDLCFMVGIFRDNYDSKFYWETMPPTLVDNSLFLEGEPSGAVSDICVIPHKQRPKLRVAYWTDESQPVLCMIRNPCTQAPICKSGKPGISSGHRVFDRCMTTGTTLENTYPTVLENRKNTSIICKAQGGTLPSVRYPFELRHWTTSLYFSSNLWDPHTWGAWIGLNHFKSDYYWNLSNKNVASPLEVDWNLEIGEPDQPLTGQCHKATENGWVDYSCSSTANFACEGPLIDSSQLTTTTIQGINVETTTAAPFSTTTPWTTCQPACLKSNPCPSWYPHYNSCFDSCYKVMNTNQKYFDALKICTDHGGSFVNFNSHAEFYYVTHLPEINNASSYFIGLQDWARRANGNTTINGITNYTGDPDGIWYWMDGDGPLNYTSIPSSGTNVSPSGTNWDFLIFSTRPEPAANKNDGPFVTWISYSGGNWIMPISSSNMFSANNRYICEYNFACWNCSDSSWIKWNKMCYWYHEHSYNHDYDYEWNYCRDEFSLLWKLPDETSLVFARTRVDYAIGDKMFIAAYRTSNQSWFWQVDSTNFTLMQNTNALDVYANSLDSTSNSMIFAPTNDPGNVNMVHSGFTGTAGGWRGYRRTWEVNDVMCERPANHFGFAPTTTATPATTTTTTTPNCSLAEGCCPCGWYRYLTNTIDICYLLIEDAKTFIDAQQYCTRKGGYLAIPDNQPKISFLISKTVYQNGSYWVGLTKNVYGIWSWPNNNGSNLTAEVVGSAALPTGTNYNTAVLQMTSANIVPLFVNDTAPSYPFICEIAMALNYCPVCKPPADTAGLTMLANWTNWQYLGGPLTMPLRVSPDKCIWVFQQTGTSLQNTAACNAAGLSPVALYHSYENKLMRNALSYLGTSIWIDLTKRPNTSFTWEGEPTSYNRWALKSQNDWQTPCVFLDSNSLLRAGSCENKHSPMCTIPPASTCPELCPFGYTAVAKSCFLVHLATVTSPFDARNECWTKHGTYTLASITSAEVLDGLAAHLKAIKAAPGSHFWIGLDDSIRISHNELTYSKFSYSADPDGVWEMDNGETFSMTTAWDIANPVVGQSHTFTVLYYNGTSLKLRTTKSGGTISEANAARDAEEAVANASTIAARAINPAAPAVPPVPTPAGVPADNYFICERPKPCLTCPKDWLFFNGHCYYLYSFLTNTTGIRVLRGYCDFYQSYVVSISSPIEERFIEKITGHTNDWWLGLYRTKSSNSTGNKADASFYEWEDGRRLSETRFSNWHPGSPDMASSSPKRQLVNIWAAPDNGWNDRDFFFTRPTRMVCEKPAMIASIQCPYQVSTGVPCGDNIITPTFTYSASSSYSTYTPLGVVSGAPWCHAGPFDVFPGNHWIKVNFGSTPYFVRAVATLGGQSVAGMITAYQVQFLETYGGTSFTDLYVHKSVSGMTKMAPVVFAGNAVSNTKNSQEICPRLKAYELKMIPLFWLVMPYMRIEVKGCRSSTANVATFCECWVESFDNSINSGKHSFWTNRATADSYTSGAEPKMAAVWYDDSLYTSNAKAEYEFPGGWTPNTFGDDNNWWQVTFAVLKVVTGLVMRGNDSTNEFITSYYVKWSHTGYEYTFNYYYGIDSFPRLFAGPSFAAAVTQQSFCPPMKTIALRIIPASYYSKPTMVVDVFACMARGRRCYDCCDEIGLCNCNCPVGYTGSSCATLATDMNYFIDAQPPVCESDELISKLSNIDISKASSGNGTNGNGNLWIGFAWIPLTTDRLPYWQADFKRVMSISIVKVAGNSASYVSIYNLYFLVQNTDSSLFYPILEQQNNPQSAIKAIPGARLADPTMFTPFYFCPNIRTRALRIAPVVRNGSSFAMRFKIYGCPPHAPCSTCCTHSEGCQCKCPVGYSTNYGSNVITANPWDHCDQWTLMPVDCEDYLLRQPGLSSGVYTIFPPGQSQMSVFCDMTTLGGGWTVIQNRQDNSVDFYRTWTDYRNGFGSLDQSFWLGNEKIHSITSGLNRYQLVIELTTTNNQLGIAYYSSFYLDDEQHGYALYFDDDVCNQIGDSLQSHRGQRFYTKDNDTAGFHCAANSYGGWWYRSSGTDTTTCHDSNLNGYLSGTLAGALASWKTWRGYAESMVTTRMLIRRSPLPNILQPLKPQYPIPIDCEDILEANPASPSGTYDIYPVGAPWPVTVYCEMIALGGGWTVIQRRFDSSISFNRNWTDYTHGFGSSAGNHYLGNYWISLLTNAATTNLPYRMAAVLEDSTGEKRTATYEPFLLDSSQDFALRYWYYNPDGDNEHPGDILKFSNGRTFQTRDRNVTLPCPNLRQSGWWFKNKTSTNCSEANLNGAYGVYTFEGGIYAAPWKGRYESLKSATMMVRRSGPKPVDCADLYDPYSSVYNTSDIYWIYPYGMEPIQVMCRFDSWKSGQPVGAYTVIQRRMNNNVAFVSRTWADYKKGFWAAGTKSTFTDYWLGLDTIHGLVQSRAYSVRVRVGLHFNSNGSDAILSQFYDDFYVMDETERYALYVDNANVGDAGDALRYNNLMSFSTVDNVTAGAESCLNNFLGGWWYNPERCKRHGTSNLNAKLNELLTNGGSYWKGFPNYDDVTVSHSEISLFRKASPAILNLPRSTTTQVCPSKSIIRHSCQPMYQQVAGDQLRMMDSRIPGSYSGTDLLCRKYPEPMDCTYFQSIADDKFVSTTHTLTAALTGTFSFTAFCDQETMGGGWTVIQRRLDDSQTFLMDMESYETTFGIPYANFWLGNSIVRSLTTTAQYELLVEMKTNSSYGFALYDSFYLSSDVSVLHLDNSYNPCSTAGDSLKNSEGKAFAYDNCGSGAWWFPQTVPCAYPAGNNTFPTSNLNAPYGTQIPTSKGIFWWTYENGTATNFIMTSMKIRRTRTRGRYIKAANYSCSMGSSDSYSAVNETQCQDFCTKYTDFICLIAVFNRLSNNCVVRDTVCDVGQGSTSSLSDTYFRMDACSHVSEHCGPPPIMASTEMRIAGMPTVMSVNYTCISGLNNLAFSQDWTVLVCNRNTKKWEGQWLDCKSLCGSIPDLSSGHAVLTPQTSVFGGTMVVYYACQTDYELIYGDLTRICAPPYGNWTGGAVMCNSTSCDDPPVIDHSQNDFTSVPLADRNRRYAIWNYTCNPGYVFLSATGARTQWKTIKCLEDRLWYPTNLGICAPFRCSNPQVFDNAIVSPAFTNATIFEYGARLTYTCLNGLVLDPLNWDPTVTIACIGNETWSVVDYPGSNKTWLPWRCICKASTEECLLVVFPVNQQRFTGNMAAKNALSCFGKVLLRFCLGSVERLTSSWCSLGSEIFFRCKQIALISHLRNKKNRTFLI